MRPIIQLLGLAMVLGSATAKTCFFSKKYCSDYCCTDKDSPFEEYCCSDCTKGDIHDCGSPVLSIVFGVIGVIVFIGIVAAVAVAIVCGCICTQLTGRTRYAGRLPFRPQPTVTTVITSQAPGGYPQTGQYPVQNAVYPAQICPPQTTPYSPQTAPYQAQGYQPKVTVYPPQGTAYPPQGTAYPPQGTAYPPQGMTDQPPPPYSG